LSRRANIISTIVIITIHGGPKSGTLFKSIYITIVKKLHFCTKTQLVYIGSHKRSINDDNK